MPLSLCSRLPCPTFETWRATTPGTRTTAVATTTTTCSTWSASTRKTPRFCFTIRPPCVSPAPSTASQDVTRWEDSSYVSPSSATTAYLAPTALNTSSTLLPTDLTWLISMGTQVCQNCTPRTRSARRRTFGASRGFCVSSRTRRRRTFPRATWRCGTVTTSTRARTG